MHGPGLDLALILSIVAFYFLFRLVRNIVPLLAHGIVGVALFYALSYFGILHVPVDIVTFLIGAFGGVLGVAIVIVLAALGVPL